MTHHDAENRAVGRFGPASRSARAFDRFETPFRILLLLASAATALVGAWLVFVILVVLPSRDPGHIALWRTVALASFVYSALSWTYLVKGPRVVWLRTIVLVLSVAAIAAGVYGIVDMIGVARSGGHFEGYIVLMGLIIAGHGLSAILYTLLSSRIARSVRAAG